VRILEALGTTFQLHGYEVEDEKLDAVTVASKVGLPPEQVFKTLLVKGDREGYCFAVIAANMELDLKALARSTGDRKMELVPMKELFALTGYIRGGVTVLGAKKEFPVYIDFLAQLCEIISVSAGVRGTQIFLAPEDYIRATGAKVAEIAR
jgi:Cys-tRNA(Pro)/Cys-tRNA(Cys) deacylase